MHQPPADQFLKACEATAPLQFLVERAKQGEIARVTVPLPFALVGYDKRTDINLHNGAGISRRHTYLQVAGGRLWCIDLNSRSGTRLQPARGTPGLLSPGRTIRIGPYTIRLAEGCPEVEEGSPPPTPWSTPCSRFPSLPRVGLEVTQGETRHPSRLVDRILTLVGRSAYCRVRLPNPKVSRTHCALLHTPTGFWLIDLLGRDGTHVNGTSVRWALLEDGDEIGIGPYLLRVHFLTQPGTANGLLPPAQAIVPSASLPVRLPAEIGSLLTSPMARTPPASAIIPAEGGVSESLLMPLLSQFSLMTQQMFDQFQQTILMMAQTFGDLHREQLQLIRQELNQLHRVTRELREVQMDLAKQPPAANPTEASAPPPPRPELSSTPSAPEATRGEDTARAKPATQPTSASSLPAAEVHTWLTQRLAALQEERQTRWQKILQTLTGKSGAEAQP